MTTATADGTATSETVATTTTTETTTADATGKTPEQIASETAAATAAAKATADAETARLAADAAKAAPEKYALTVPEGQAFDLTSFEARAKAKGWNNEVAQQELTEALTALNDQHTRLRAEAEAHPEIGGDKLAVTEKHARAALDRFLPPNSTERTRLEHDMATMRLENYTPWVLLLARIGKAMAEDTPLTASTSPSGEKPQSKDVFWPQKK